MVKENKYYLLILTGMLLLLGLWITSLYSYLLFHSLAELFSIAVAWAIFMLAWNARRFLDNSYLLFIGIAYLFVGSLDLLHTLGYTGMGVFPGYNTNLPTQLWICARYMEALSLLIGCFLLGRQVRMNLVVGVYGVATALLLGSIFYWDVFPTCFVEGVGLTPFKKISEYVISLILLVSIVMLHRKRAAFDPGVLRLLIASILVTIGSELAFTLYVHAYGLPNLVGHYLKIVSFYLIYKAIVETGLRRPYALLFRDLKRSENHLKAAKDNLELRVNMRTAQLTQTNEALRREITDRKRVEQQLQDYQQRLKALASQLTIAEERERSRIAADLHDLIGHSLALARIQLDAVPAASSNIETTLLIKDISRILLKAIQDTKNLIFELSSPSINELGLAAAISEWLEEQIANRHNLKTEFIDDIDDNLRKKLDDNVRAILFRNVRELLTNVIKHAKAKNVCVALENTEENVKMTVMDDGVGFDPESAFRGEKEERGFGLFSIQERMADLGGAFEIVSKPGKGCKALLTLPLRKILE